MVILALLDMSSAFDTVDHDILLGLLCHKFKITGKVISWLESYLKGRTFAAKIKYANGGRCLMIYGVPKAQSWGLYYSFYILMIYLKLLLILMCSLTPMLTMFLCTSLLIRFIISLKHLKNWKNALMLLKYG